MRDSAFKAKVAFEAEKGDKTIAEIAAIYGMTTHAAIKNTFSEDFSVQKCLTIIRCSDEWHFMRFYNSSLMKSVICRFSLSTTNETAIFLRGSDINSSA